MKYCVELRIPHKQLAVINGFLTADTAEKYQGEDNLITNSVTFPDGYVMDIKCCGCDNESSWTEAVLFAPAGDGVGLCEVNCSEPDESYKGEWEFKTNNTIYRVVVIDGGNISKCCACLLNNSDLT